MKNKIDSSGKKRPTIGLIINDLDRYQAMVWPAIADAAEKHNANLILFVGKSIKSPYSFEINQNIIYDLAGSDSLDGLLIMTGPVCAFLSRQESKNFCYQYQPLPTVSVALQIDGIPSVVVDNKVGMQSLMNHLIKDHGYKKIAFIKGPASSPEAYERFQAYQEALKSNLIPYDPALVCEGNYFWATGIDAVKTLLDTRKVKFDCLVSTNDEMLIGAYLEFSHRGIDIPEHFAATGFDNINESATSNPPITTVKQPMYETAYRATEILIDMILGKKPPELTSLPSELIIRQSCGCKAGPATTNNSQTTSEKSTTYWTMRKIAQAISGAFNWQHLHDALIMFLPMLEITHCYIAIYDVENKHLKEPAIDSKLFLAFQPEYDKAKNQENIAFRSKKLLPEKLLDQSKRHSFVIFPMLIQDEQYGFIIFNFDKNIDPAIYGTLQDHISSAIKGTALIDQVTRQKEELTGNLEKLRMIMGKFINAISVILETSDPYTAGHQNRVADLARAIAIDMGLSNDQIESIRVSGVLHDVGKIFTPTQILNKPGKLMEEEFNLIKTHPKIGYNILKQVDFPWPVADIILQHHEKMDGSGYPQGLKGDQILIEARIICVADVVEAMASHRPYRPALGVEAALNEIQNNKGKYYDPKVVDCCIKLFKEKGFVFREYFDSFQYPK